jgi:hypothetical protein
MQLKQLRLESAIAMWRYLHGLATAAESAQAYQRWLEAAFPARGAQ